ncbi:SusC/RagA family TonB-linked outer membrane protein [Chitinophagaceae bacterium 26-R-25]|nr:SusC/RagA family TonB-linked outer membrane protein [Chitinophagaceae bacterium 26-R-25]
MTKQITLKRICKVLFAVSLSLTLPNMPALAAQDPAHIKISFSNETLSAALIRLSGAANVSIAFDANALGANQLRVKSRSFQDADIKEVLDFLLSGTNITYGETSGGIVLKMNAGKTTAPVKGGKGKISGTIHNENGEILPNATITIVETGETIVSGNDGSFSVAVNDGVYTLNVSYTSFQTETLKKIVVKDDKTSSIRITLKPIDSKLTDVVVTALGIKKDQKRLGYAQQSIKADELTKAPEPNPMTSLTGKIAGLSVNNSNEMLQAPTFNLRGAAPVIVVDGVPVETDFYDVKPDDIESITVLKGTTASALYGSRGKDGAIMIITKRGSGNKKPVEVEFNTSNMFQVGFLTLPKTQKHYGTGSDGVYLYTEDWNSPNDDAGGGAGSWGPKLDAGVNVVQWDSPIDPTTGKRTPTPWVSRGKDNLKNFVQTGLVSNTNFSVSKNFDKGSVRFSLSHMYQRGQIPNSSLNITGFSIASNLNFTQKLHLDAYMAYDKQYTNNYPFAGYGRKNAIYNVLIWEGVDTDIDDFKNYWQPGKEGYRQLWYNYTEYNNPWFVAKEFLHKHDKQVITGRYALTYDITPDLSIMGRVGVNSSARTGALNVPFSFMEYQGNGYSFGLNGGYQTENQNTFDLNTDLLATYNKTISKNFNIKAIAGGNIRYFQDYLLGVKADGLNVPGVYNFTNAANPVFIPQDNVNYTGTSPNYTRKKQVNSMYASADLNFYKAFTLSITGRRDQSSALSTAHNSYFYPSAAMAVSLSDLIKMPSYISYAKVRASVAQVSNDLGIYQLNQYYNAGTIWNGTPSVTTSTTLNNPNIDPAKSVTQEYGGEIYFLGGRIKLDGAYFHTLDMNQIVSLPNSEAGGYSSHTVNANEYLRKGGELALTATPVKTKDFQWRTSVNWSTYRQTIKSLAPELNGKFGNLVVGDRTDKIFGSGWAYTPDGQMIIGTNGKPTKDPNPVFKGYSTPDYIYGVSNTLQYKDLSLKIDIDGRVGSTIYSTTKEKMVDAGVDVFTDDEYNRTQNNQGIASMVIPGVVQDATTKVYSPNTKKILYYDYIDGYYSSSRSSFNWFSGTFAKIREISLTYKLPKKAFGKTLFSDASFSVIGKNLFIISKSGLKSYADPDAGVDNLQTPSPRNIGFNLNIKF